MHKRFWNAPSSCLNPMFHVQEELSKKEDIHKGYILLWVFTLKLYVILVLNIKARSLISPHSLNPLHVYFINFPPFIFPLQTHSLSYLFPNLPLIYIFPSLPFHYISFPNIFPLLKTISPLKNPFSLAKPFISAHYKLSKSKSLFYPLLHKTLLI